MSDFLNNPILNAGMGLGGGLGAMPVALPFTLGGAVPGIFGSALGSDTRQNILGALPFAAAGGVGAGAGAMAMQPNESQQMSQPSQEDVDKINQISGRNNMSMAEGQTTPASYQAQQAANQAEKGMSNSDMMKLASMGMQGFNKGQMQIQQPTQQIIRDNNQFRFAGNPQQQMAQALRNRG